LSIGIVNKKHLYVSGSKMIDDLDGSSEKSVFLDRVEASYNPSPRISTKSGILVSLIL